MIVQPTPWSRWGTAVVVGMVLALMGAPARAASRSAALDYHATADCPDGAHFSAVVAKRLGYNPFRAEAAQQVIVRITRAGRELEGRLEWRDGAGGWLGDKRLPSHSGDCVELVRAMGLALAIQFQLMMTVPAEPEVKVPPSPSAPPLSPPPLSTSPSATGGAGGAPAPSANPPLLNPSAVESIGALAPLPSPDATATATVKEGDGTPKPNDEGARGRGANQRIYLLGGGGGLALGVAANPIAIGRLFGAVNWSHVLISVEGEIGWSTTMHSADGAGFSQRNLLGGVAGCGVFRPWGACLLAKVGQLQVAGFGLDVPATATGVLAEAGVRFIVTHTLGSRFEIGGHADGLASLTTGTVLVDLTEAWSTPRFTAVFGVDLGVRFW